ncbi:Putative protein of unknown function similar to meiotically up-regulated gene 157 protein of Schizosaccharomyces pombe [Podospora comata]|uniref:Uncharacterized protein n=1 Tax=Podospora comata TaxID=48703 RepID=A0ABY6S9Q5_PODCO|nr:Putative protein of unknown function similar to meiotically up-regulated gene 157 protein of Schizosaccharomyces pombe [Podospora comata]
MRASILLVHTIAVLAQAQPPRAQLTLEPEPPSCPDYSGYSSTHHEPKSAGRYKLSYQRPRPSCRTFTLPEVEDTIISMKQVIKDPDLFRLFENCFPNTLDTAITWKGLSWRNASSYLPTDINSPDPTPKPTGNNDPEEELTFITTGDIPAMWLRDSAHQLTSYSPLLTPSNSTSSLASLYRGLINLQARYILTAPTAMPSSPPPESLIPPPQSDDSPTDHIYPPLPSSPGSPKTVHECKYELDSLASFLSLIHTYLTQTSDTPFLTTSLNLLPALKRILSITTDLQTGTYSRTGTVSYAPYQFQRLTTISTETLPNAGSGPPFHPGTNLVRSAFRPSDDACTYQGFIPGNMMFSSYLSLLSPYISPISPSTSKKISKLAAEIRAGIEDHGRIDHRLYGRIYAYEIDGYGSHSLMDDANIPSLLSAPLLGGYLDRRDETYQRTRRFALSQMNPYYMFGPVLNATGGPHIGPGMAWPMGLIVQALTSDDDDEIYSCIKQLLSSTDGLGLMHESVNTHSVSVWTRHWFSWANGLFGQLILDVNKRKPHLLARSYQ